MTNFEKVKNMNIDEMTEFFTKFGNYCGNQCCYCSGECLDGTCKKRITQWLNKEVKPTLSETERVILENIDKEYKWIAKDRDGTLYFYSKKPTKLEAFWENIGKCAKPNVFNHLFQFITWQDDEPYNIEELLNK